MKKAISFILLKVREMPWFYYMVFLKIIIYGMIFRINYLKVFKVIAIDLPGFGQSDNFSEVHSMEFMAGVVKDVLDQEEVSSCVITGHSMGGYVSLAFLEQFPAYLKGLILFHSHAAADTDEAKKNRERTVKIVEANKKDFIKSVYTRFVCT